MNSSLNDKQKLAVESSSKYLMVLAGAGSGKTRVIAQKIIYLLTTGQTTAENFLALTFTNKAANEMKHRIGSLIADLNTSVNPKSMWIGTFHSIGHRLLRIHHKVVGLEPNFLIMDSDDQLRAVKKILAEAKKEDEEFTPQKIQNFISKIKDKGIRSKDFVAKSTLEKELADIYQRYEDYCYQNHLVDFSEILLRSYELLANNPDILARYQEKFTHLLVDEFQDTNDLQYRWIKLLAGKKVSICVVGDDDQSIYSWRGAEVANIENFIKEYKCEIIKLEQNYRSTQNILNFANEVIKTNQNRIGKDLWTENNSGNKIDEYVGYTDRDEADHLSLLIISYIKEKGYSHKDIAILYRSNYQSREIERSLIVNNIAYRIYGGHKFYDRVEIKNCLAYIRLLYNKNDDISFERIINFPTRGVGATSLQRIADFARENSLSLYESMLSLMQYNVFGAKSKESLRNLIEKIDKYTKELSQKDGKFSSIIAEYIHSLGVIQAYKATGTDEDKSRVENIEEFFNEVQYYDGLEDPLLEFLTNASLDAGEMQTTEGESVSLMTIHASKGLEFPIVFLCGVEDGLLPHENSLYDMHQIAEERRLFYVASTRAMKHLHISRCEKRRVRGFEMRRMPSRFLSEVSDTYLNKHKTASVNMGMKEHLFSRRSYTEERKETREKTIAKDSMYSVGMRVKHPVFGEGVILNISKYEDKHKLQIKFKSDIKWIITGFVEIEIIS